MNLRITSIVLIYSILILPTINTQCQQQSNCFMPKCYCSNQLFPQMNIKDIPQMVYFAFDDAVTPVVAKHYNRIFTPIRQNPNGCPIKMSLYISHNYTDYGLVRDYYRKGHEIAVHSVNHMRVDNEDLLFKEAKLQKDALVKLAGVQEKNIWGWRSPFLLPAGDDQPRILKQLGFKYDISLTYTRASLQDNNMIWPFTLDYGWPHRCQIPECPKKSHPGFWEVPVISMMDKDNKYPCAYVDGCHSPIQTEQDAYDYLWNNFNSYYQGSRAPLGFHMHAAWFQYPTYDRIKVVNTFLDKILQLKDVYVITVKQLLEWMEDPTPAAKISNLKSWSCNQSRNNIIQILSKQRNISNSMKSNMSTNSLNPKKISNNQNISIFNQIERIDAGLFSRRQGNQWISMDSNSAQYLRERFEPRSVIDNINPRNEQVNHSNQLNHTDNMGFIQFTTLSPKLIEFNPISRWNQMKSRSSSIMKPSHFVHNNANVERINTQISIDPNLWSPLNIHTMPHSEMSKRLQNDQVSWQQDNQDIRLKKVSPSVLSQGFNVSNQTPATVRHYPNISRQNINKSSTSAQSLTCQKDTNCFLPNCFCKTTEIPLMPAYQRPQLLLLNFDGPINHLVYTKYETLFNTRANPDRCPIRGTLFVSARTNSTLVKKLYNMGLEISLRGLVDTSYRSYQKMRQDIINQMHSLTFGPQSLQMRDIKGWRSPSLKPVGDEQYKILKAFGFLYDSTLISKRVFNGKNGLFPFTLDYGWDELCQQERCPQNKHLGLWEIPISSLQDIKNGYSCNYADSCPQPMMTAEETEEFLWQNFLRHYQSNRHPFSINLSQKWFHWNYHQNYQGLVNFIDRVLGLGNAYFVSIADAIKWIQSPVKLSEIPVRC